MRSILEETLEQFRFTINTPDGERYDNDYFVKRLVRSSFVDVLQRLRMSSDNVLMVEAPIVISKTQRVYTLPPDLAELIEIVQFAADTRYAQYALRPKDSIHVGQWGFRMEPPNRLVFDRDPLDDSTWMLRYIPSGDIGLHYATDGSLTGTALTLSSSPLWGDLDVRENAYVGAMVRVISGTRVDERLITAYNRDTRVATLDSVTAIPNGTVTYEVLPALFASTAMQSAVSTLMILKFAEQQRLQNSEYVKLEIAFRRAMKTLQDLERNRFVAKGSTYPKGTAYQEWED